MYNKIINRTNNKELLNEKDIKEYIVNELNQNNLNYLVDKITINNREDYLGAYNNETKEIIINANNIHEVNAPAFVIYDVNTKCVDSLLQLNIALFRFVEHELYHVKQNDIINKEDGILRNILINDLKAIRENFNLYYYDQNIFVSEYSANYIGFLKTIELAEQIFSKQKFSFARAKDFVSQMEMFVRSKNIYGTPYEQFNKKTDRKSVV